MNNDFRVEFDAFFDIFVRIWKLFHAFKCLFAFANFFFFRFCGHFLISRDFVYAAPINLVKKMAKLKVLCLHGYRQNETIFRERTGALRKLLKRNVDFFFISAPHVIPEEENLKKPADQQERGWFFSRPEKGYKGTDETDTCIGLEQSLKTVQEAFINLGPFDGILAFSQGGCFASMFPAYKDTYPELQFQFIIFFSGFKSLLKVHRQQLYGSSQVNCPTFHTIGLSDTVIPAAMSRDLVTHYQDAVTYEHNGGHFIPASPQLRTALQDFLKPFLD